MKHVKASSLLLGFVLLLSASLFAQDKKVVSTPEGYSAMITDWMKTNLALSEEQVVKVQDINLKYANKKQAIKNNSQVKEEKMKLLKESEAAKDAELKAVLTADQFKTYEAKKEELKKEMKSKKEGGGVKNG